MEVSPCTFRPRDHEREGLYTTVPPRYNRSGQNKTETLDDTCLSSRFQSSHETLVFCFCHGY